MHVSTFDQYRHRDLQHPATPPFAPDRATPAVAYQTRPKAVPDGTSPDSEFRVRRDKVSSGSVTLRVDGHLHHIGLGQPLNGTPIVMLIHGYDIRVIHAATGEIIRRLTINPELRYHGTGAKRGGPSRPYGPRKARNPNPETGSSLADVSRHHMVELRGIEPLTSSMPCVGCRFAVVRRRSYLTS